MPRGLLQKASYSVVEANFEFAAVGGDVAEGGHASDFEVVAAGLEDVEIFVGELEVELAGVGRLAVERELEAQAVAQPDDGWSHRREGLVADQPMSQAEAAE